MRDMRRERGTFAMIASTHLKDRELSLKAKGLLSLMLSLPQTWSYSVRGLSAICGDGECSVRSALKELEDHGYLRRTEKERDRSGHIGGTKYVVYETPRLSGESEIAGRGAKKTDDKAEEKIVDKVVEKAVEKAAAPEGVVEKPAQENPVPEKPTPEKRSQSNIHLSKKQEYQNHDDKIHLSIDQTERIEQVRQECREQLGADDVVSESGKWEKMVGEMAEIMVEARLCTRDYMNVGRNTWRTDFVRERFSMLRPLHRDMILMNVAKHEGEIRNMRAYLAAAMFNAPTSAEFERFQERHAAVNKYALPGMEDVEEEADL